MTTMNGGSGGADANNNNAKRPQIEDAKDFLERVKRTFEDDKTVYNQFVEIMKNFKHDHINTRHTIERVRQLFLNHPTLFEGFQNFLPAAGLVSKEEIARINSMRSANSDTASNGGTGDTSHNHVNGGNGLNGHNNTNTVPPNTSNLLPNNTTSTDQGNAAPPDFNMAVTFICKIKQRFGSHRKIYQDFLSILQHFQTAAQDHDTSVIKDVKMRIRTLFRDHPDLLDQFDYFLPPLTAHFARAGQSASPSSAAVGTSNNTESSNNRNGRKRPAEDDLDNQPDTKRRRRGDERSSRRRTSRSEKNADSEWQPNGNTDNLSTIPNAGNSSSIATTDINMSTRSSSRSRKRHRERNKSRDGSSKRHHRDRDTKSRDKKDREHRSSHSHSHHHRGDDRVNNTNDANVSDEDEQIFFSDTDDEESGHNNYNDDEHQGLRIFSKLRKDIPDHLYRHVLTLTQLYPMGLTEFSVVGKLICDALKEHGHLELMKEFQKELQSSKQSWFFRSRGQNYYEYLTNNLLLKSCKAIQSSYRELPGDVVQPRCSGRHPDAAKVLNDYYVSKPTGGEGGGNNGNDAANSAGGRLKSQYNEALQKTEDDLFELDMMIQTNDAARKRLEQLYKTVMQPKNLKNIQNGGNMLEIPPVEKRAVSRLYSEHGTKVLNLLKKMPETTIPVVLKRLREKSLEWEQLKNEMKPVWKSVATKNYFKAHDFRWTIFKQHDNKRISFKNIVKQIEERHLSRKHLNAVAANTALLGLKKEKMKKANQKEENDDDDNDEDKNKENKKKMDVEEEEDEDIDLKQDIPITTQQNADDNNNDEDDDDDVIKPPKLEFDPIHHSSTRRIDDCQLDCFETDIAAQHPYGLHSGFTNNGVISGVGLIGNSHDHIIQQMGAGLHVELGDYVEMPLNTKVNNHDYRFVIYDKNILKDCVRFIYQFANKEEVGSEKAQKRRFVEVMDSLFTEFFKLDIKEQSIEFLENRNEEEYSPQSTNTSTSSQDSPEPISKIIQKTVKQDEKELNDIDIKKCNQTLINKYKLTYFENSKPSVEMYGNRHLYALFRYLHLLYARMNYALRLCKEENPLYKVPETQQEIQRKYKDYLSHLSKWLNEQISDEQYEDECRSLLGLKAYQLYTLNKVIQQCYKMICEIDCDQNIHPFYKLFLSMNQKKKSAENSIKHYIKASQISLNPSKGQTEELYKIEYYNQKILCISLMDKYIPSTHSQNQSPSHTQNNKDNDVKMSDNSNNRNTN